MLCVFKMQAQPQMGAHERYNIKLVSCDYALIVPFVMQSALELRSWIVVESTHYFIRCKVHLVSCFHEVVEVATTMCKKTFLHTQSNVDMLYPFYGFFW
jgi:hypothetical protein